LIAKGLLVFTALYLCVALSGCGPSYMVDTPRVFGMCSERGGNPPGESFDAVVGALNSRHGWLIHDTDEEKRTIHASVCSGGFCDTIDFRVLPDGNVEALRTGRVFRDDRTLMNWMNAVEKLYNKERCR
jgi:hypothetical protein